MNYSTYLAFDDALEAAKYYELNYGAVLKNHEPLSEEYAKYFNIVSNDLSKTTFSATLHIFETDFQISDRFLNKGDFSDSVNLLIDFTPEEINKFEHVRKLVISDKDATYEFDNDSEGYEMLRLKDKYGLTWAFILIKEEC